MITLELTPGEIASLSLLEEGEQIEVEYYGLPCFIVYDPDSGDVEIKGKRYRLGFYDPTEWKIKVSKLVTVRVVFHFLHRTSEVRTFKAYHRYVKEAIKKYIRESPELYDCTDYRYMLIDDEGRIIK